MTRTNVGPPRFIEVGSVMLRCQDMSGPAEAAGTPLVLVHEMGGSLESWDGLVSLLHTHRRIVRFDLRGYGLSEKPCGSVAMSTLIADLEALLNALGIALPVTLAGSAMGAAIALSFAARHPARVTAVVALAPAADPPRTGIERILTSADEIEAGGMRPRMELAMRLAWPSALRSDAGLFERYRARWLGNDPSSYAAGLRMLAGMDLRARLPHVSCPVCVMAGSLDGNRTPAQLETLFSPLPQATFTTLNTGHFMAVQTPELVAPEMLRFLARHGL